MMGRSRFPVIGCACVARHLVTGAAALNSISPMRRLRPIQRCSSQGFHTFDRDIRAKTFLGERRRFVDGGGYRSKAASPVQCRVPRLAVLVARRDPVPDHSQWKRVHARGNRIFREAENVLLDHRGETPAPGCIQDVVKQNFVSKLDAQSKCLVIELEPESGQSRRVDEGNELLFCTPGIVRSGRVVASEAENPITGDSPTGKDFQGITFFAAEALHRIPEQCCDAHRGSRKVSFRP